MSYKHSTTTKSTSNKKPVEQSHWQGSVKTASLIKGQIAERWGEDEAEKYDPDANCFTFQTWKAKGYRVKKGEKALRSFTIVSGTDGEGEDQKSFTYPKGVCLFYILQVEKQ